MKGAKRSVESMCGIQSSYEKVPAVSGSAGVKGAVARIERLAVHDGPGIRTVVFLKGCPLRCSWCSSPETQLSVPELLFDRRRCLQCGACLAACPAEAINQTKNGEIQTDRSLCDGCGRCARTCPSGARRRVGTPVTVHEIVKEIEKDEVFYHRSGGGVTISGGEPLAMPVFTREILRECAARGIHTAMETSACAPWDRFAALLGSLDLVFVDIKHMDDAVHRQITGTGNRLILENLRKLAQGPAVPALIVRVPVIPGINDAAENIRRTAAFVEDIGRVLRIELLPYHRYGLHAYEALGRRSATASIPVPGQERMQYLAELAGERGVAVQIGG